MKQIEALISEIPRGKCPQCLLLHGDGLQVYSASKALVDLLVPSNQRSFNLERFNGRTTLWETIDVALRTPPLLQGKKIVLVEDAPYFVSREHKDELGEKSLQLWREGKQDQAARLFLDLLLVEGWTQERWEALEGSLTARKAAELVGSDDAGVRAELEAMIAHCRNGGMRIDAHRGSDGPGLMELLENGLPPWAIFMITAAQVDRRTRLYKRFEEKGLVLDLTLNRDKTGRISREAVTEFLDRRLKEVGKTLEVKARELILARAGDELWSVHGELEKLFLYVGEETRIKVEDVQDVFLDGAEAWVFNLTAAIASRHAMRALEQLSDLLSQGEHPLRLLATLASEIRRLLMVRQMMEGEMRGRWKSEMSYPEFQRMLPQGPVITRNAYGDYLSFQKAGRFSTRKLLTYLQSIYQTDIRLKSTGKSPRLTMERLILEMCTEHEPK